MKVFFHPEAEAEFNWAVEHYESCQKGLGLEFAGEVYAAIMLIKEYPNAWSRLSKRSRRCLLNRFPFGIIYQLTGREVRIIAVAHLHKRPSYWKERKK